MYAECDCYPHIPYTCRVTSLPASQRAEWSLESMHVNHIHPRSNKHVLRLRITDQKIRCLPKNLHKTFPSLERLTVNRCGLKQISNDDLKRLKNLEEIDLSCNKLELLPDDLFEGLKKLKTIYFDDNPIRFMSSNLLKPIEGTLEVAGFERSSNVNDFYGKGFQCKNDLQAFMKSIDDKCQSFIFIEDPQVYETPKLGDATSDFILHAYEKEFKVHKQLFAEQSSVFAKTTAELNEFTFKTHKKYKESSFVAFLNYFYSGSLEGDSDINEIHKLASKWKVHSLVQVLEEVRPELRFEAAKLEANEAGKNNFTAKEKISAFEIKLAVAESKDVFWVNKAEFPATEVNNLKITEKAVAYDVEFEETKVKDVPRPNTNIITKDKDSGVQVVPGTGKVAVTGTCKMKAPAETYKTAATAPYENDVEMEDVEKKVDSKFKASKI